MNLFFRACSSLSPSHLYTSPSPNRAGSAHTCHTGQVWGSCLVSWRRESSICIQTSPWSCYSVCTYYWTLWRYFKLTFILDNFISRFYQRLRDSKFSWSKGDYLDSNIPKSFSYWFVARYIYYQQALTNLSQAIFSLMNESCFTVHESHLHGWFIWGDKILFIVWMKNFSLFGYTCITDWSVYICKSHLEYIH